jgi:DNA ligase D
MASKLGPYRGKRDFARTGEPEGGLAPGGGNRFVVHKHHATADHYDLRLELDGVLKSWAVPKGPSLDPEEKRLAVETEDHPLEYADFEGLIPEGQYGAGPMIVWDAGTWAPMGDPAADLAKGAFKFRLSGEKLHGGWMLARLKGRPGETKTNWLLFKERDPAADAGTDILVARPESVKSGLRIEELVPLPPAAPARAKRLRPGALPGAAKAAAPARVAPQLPSPREAPPEGDGWLHEIKLDGYRTLALVEGGPARLITRGGLDWTARYGDLAGAFAALRCKSAAIDGEIVVLDEKGVSRFARLQEALSRGPGAELVFFAFDLLHLDGWDLTASPLERRKGLLADLLATRTPRSAIQFSDHVVGDGAAFFERVSEMELEGVVSKRRDAPYQPGRSKSWIKTKARAVGDFVIAGYTTSQAAGGLAALAVAEWEGDELAYRGKVGTGFDAATLEALLARLETLREGAAGPLARAPREVVPVRPVLTAHIHFTDRTSDGSLRHAVFKGLREVAVSGADPAPRRRLVSEADLAAITITNPRRRLFGRSGATKLDVAVYYAAIGDFMLPHLFGRPVSLLRCPSGRSEDCFFQRHPFTGMPPSLAVVEAGREEGEDRRYVSVEDARGFLALAQFGVVEFHAWGCRRADLERPDRVVFDLDPGEGITWREVVEAAAHVRGVLEALGLVPFAKTTGGRGVHVVVPITPRLDWSAVHDATGRIAGRIAAGAPDVFTTTMGPKNRKGKIFVDFHRNARSATAVAPYSLRARAHLPASAPLGWSDLEAVDAPEDLNYSSLPGLIGGSGDPWAAMDESARDLPA